MPHRLARGLLAASATALLAAPLAAQEGPIRLTLHDWTGQIITTTIMGEVLEAAGLPVE